MGNIRYHLSGDRPEHLSAKLLYLSSSRYEGDWYSLKHSHPFTELFYVCNGSGKFIVDDTAFPISKDDLVIVNSNLEHTELSFEAAPLDYIILGVEGIHFSFKEHKEYVLLNCGDDRKLFLSYFTAMLKELEQKKANCELVCQNLLEVLIIHLTRLIDYAIGGVPVQKTNRECSRIKRYLEASYAENITLELLAEMAHLNKYYFAHAFTQNYGVSPISYLNEQRIQASKELLLSTDHSIAEISQLAGFSSQSYFAQCFRKSCGMSAGAFRKTKRPENN